MQITDISISYELTQSLSGYCNVKPGIRLSAHLDEGENSEAVKLALLDEARVFVQDEIDQALIADDQPPRYYAGPRFMVMLNSESRRVVILPDQNELMHTLPGPGNWVHSFNVRPGRGMRLDQAHDVAVRMAASHIFPVVDCHDGDLSRLADGAPAPSPEPDPLGFHTGAVLDDPNYPFDDEDDEEE